VQIEQAAITATVGQDILWRPINIYPFGDLHSGGGGYEKLFRRELKVLIDDPNGYALGMGDYIDLMSPSNRAEIQAAKLYDSAINELDRIADRYVTHIKTLLRGSEGKWLGFLEGHHWLPTLDGLTTDMKIAEAMGAPFLGSCAFVRLAFKPPPESASRHRQTCDIWCHHGAGGGVLASAPLNRLERVVRAFDADIYFIGHHHKQVAARLQQLYMTRKRPYELGHRDQIIACTGGYMRGYLLDNKVGRVPRGSYVEKGMMAPSALGGIRVSVTPSQRGPLKMEVTM